MILYFNDPIVQCWYLETHALYKRNDHPVTIKKYLIDSRCNMSSRINTLYPKIIKFIDVRNGECCISVESSFDTGTKV